MLSLRRKRVHGAETDLQAVNGGNGMCDYPVSNIQYPLFNDGGANWILAVGYLHIQHMLSFPSHGARGKEKQTPQRRNPTWHNLDFDFCLLTNGQ